MREWLGLGIVILAFFGFVALWRGYFKKQAVPKGKTIAEHEAFLAEIPDRFPNVEPTYCEKCQCKHHPYQPHDARYANVKCKNCGEPGHFECFYD